MSIRKEWMENNNREWMEKYKLLKEWTFNNNSNIPTRTNYKTWKMGWISKRII